MKKIIAVIGILLLCGLILLLQREKVQRSTATLIASSPQMTPVNTDSSRTNSPLPTSTRTPLPTATVAAQATVSPLSVWNLAPVCQNEPRDTAYWRRVAAEQNKDDNAKRKLKSSFHRIRAIESNFVGSDANTLAQILELPESSPAPDLLLRDMLVTWLNIFHGELNRASEVEIPELPEIRTVGELLSAAEQSLVADVPMSAIHAGFRRLNAGEGIITAVCADMLHLRFGNQFQRTRWTDTQISTETASSELLLGDTRWLMERLIPSPDRKQIAIQTFSYEGGGPIFLYTVETGQLINVNQQIGLSLRPNPTLETVLAAQSERWEVIGWLLEDEQILLGVEGTAAAVWVDIQENEFQVIPLGSATLMNASRSRMDAAPDGSGFIYVDRKEDGQSSSINFYSLNSKQVSTLITLLAEEGNIYEPRFSPLGDRIAYLVETGSVQSGFSYSLHVYNFASGDVSTLIQGDIGRTDAVWSPDGNAIAFARKDPSFMSGKRVWPSAENWRGNIWSVDIETGEVKQITSGEGAAINPVWSVDGRSLAFFTQDGSIGMVSLDKPGAQWILADPESTRPLLSSFVFLP